MLRPSPNDSGLRLPNDDDDDGTRVDETKRARKEPSRTRQFEN